MKPQRPRTERRRKQREVAKKLDRALKQQTTTQEAVAKAQNQETTNGIRQEED